MESYRQLHWLLHPPQEMEGLVFDFSGIQTLDLTVGGAIGGEHGILDQAAHLQDFRLHSECAHSSQTHRTELLLIVQHSCQAFRL